MRKRTIRKRSSSDIKRHHTPAGNAVHGRVVAAEIDAVGVTDNGVDDVVEAGVKRVDRSRRPIYRGAPQANCPADVAEIAADVEPILCSRVV